jgi:hypothetical protein
LKATFTLVAVALCQTVSAKRVRGLGTVASVRYALILFLCNSQ